MKVLFVTSEATPFAKTGGLADVCGTLPAALKKVGVETRGVMPLYDTIPQSWRDKMSFVKYKYIQLSWRSLYCGLFKLEHDGVTWYFLDNEYYFRRGGLYGFFDDGERYAFFSKAVVELLPDLGWKPDIVHLNDWQSALVPVYMRDASFYSDYYFGIKSIFTIHNIEYQGRYGKEILGDVLGLPPGWFNDGTLEFNGGISFAKGALKLADAITTVSPTYAQELRYSFFAHGLEGVMSDVSFKTRGILNGIDVKLYDPSSDPSLAENFSPDDLSGKAACKKKLQETLGLEVSDAPIIAMVTRLASHKGLDLVTHVFDDMMALGAQFVLLGTGESKYERFFSEVAERYPGRAAVRLMYSADLSSLIYSGADMFLMPSKMEPCGLSQMIAMRYGTIPIVRETGGLRDTVIPYNGFTGEGTGFTFSNFNADEMLGAVGRAISAYESEEVWSWLMRHAMTADFSWTASAQEYKKLYKSLLE